MATNPAYGVLSPRFAGTLRSDSQNIEQVNKHKKRNKFDYSNTVYDTFRFGEVRPFFHMRALPNDTVNLNSRHELWTHVLKSPLMSDLTMYKDYFYVPMKAILPNTWDSFDSTPVQGDDCPVDTYCYMNLSRLMYMFLNYAETHISADGTASSKDIQNNFIKMFAFVYEALMSDNALIVQLGINFPQYIVRWLINDITGFVSSSSSSGDTRAWFDPSDTTKLYSIDSILETYVSSNDVSMSLQIEDTANANNRVRKYFFGSPQRLKKLQFIHFLMDLNRSSYRAVISSVNTGGLDLDTMCAYIKSLLAYLFGGSSLVSNSPFTSSSAYHVDLSPVIAYQMIGSQFYVNDNIDPVYSSRDWYNNMRSLRGVSLTDSFEYNGTDIFYDLFSSHYLNSVLSSIPTGAFQETSGLEFLKALFISFESLRYGDYFTGSRLSPLAIGADEKAVAPVVSNEVSAVDMTRSIAWQNFLNDIMKLGPVQWIQQNGIFGEIPSTLDPMPRFISRERVGIGEQHIENTAENQGEIVTRLRSSSGDFAFELSISEKSIVLGLLSFDIPRVYQNVMDRFAFTYDREDFFNPYFQNIGDQAIYASELNNPEIDGEVSPDTDFDVFSWTLRDTQYKQRVSVANSGFRGLFLPSWAFVDDMYGIAHLDSEFIRNHNKDFDRFYESLPNFTLSGYFHFYMRIRNSCTAVRAMQYRPGIQLPMIHQ